MTNKPFSPTLISLTRIFSILIILVSILFFLLKGIWGAFFENKDSNKESDVIDAEWTVKK